MGPNAFTRNWGATRELEEGQYLPIHAIHAGKTFEIARWSRFSEEHDSDKLAVYLPVPTAEFGESLPEMLDHTVKTGIGKLVTFREAPRYLLDPGGRWRAYQAARFGVPCSATIRMVASDNQDGYLRRRLEVCLGGLAAAGKGGSARF